MTSTDFSAGLIRVTALGFILSLAGPVIAAPMLPGVGAAMQTVIDAREVAGAVTAVATKDKIVHLEATGFADVAKQKPMETDAMFWIASTTKPFTGVALLMLQDEGKLSVTDPVAKYIPEFAGLKTPSGKPANLTVAQLVMHTSGLADMKREDVATAKVLADLIPATLAAPMQFEPGESWKYTSSGFNVAARIVEIVSGKSYDVFLQQRLFDPLAMKDTTFYPSEAQQARMAGNYVKNRGTGELLPQALAWPVPPRGSVPPIAAGGLFSTAGDLLQFGRMLANRGVFGGRRYLSEASFQVLTTVRTGDLATGFSRGQINKVLGWGLGAYVLRAPHAGASATLSAGSFGHPGACGTHLIVDPVKGLAYVMMVQRPNLPDNFENEPTRAFLQAVSNALAKTPQ